MSPVVQRLPSLHEAVLFAWAHPVAGTQESVVQTFPSSQFRAVPGWHTPAAQVSEPLQRLPSMQSAFVVQPPPPPVKYVTESLGRRVAVVSSAELNCHESVPFATSTQPRFDAPADQAATLFVTVRLCRAGTVPLYRPLTSVDATASTSFVWTPLTSEL